MPVPKHKTSIGRKKRRRRHLKIKVVSIIKCRKCGSDKLPHVLCKNCGSK